jgi:hypothetical protein
MTPPAHLAAQLLIQGAGILNPVLAFRRPA